jgi:hypothetical protein
MGLRKVDAARVQHLAFCLKCRFEKLGDVVAGQLEVEHEWLLRVSGHGANRVAALCALRRVPGLANTPLRGLVEQLEAAVLVVGPLSRGQASEAQAELKAAGLIVELVGA